MSAQSIVYCIHGLFALVLLLAIVWAITRPNPRDEHLLEDFMQIERRRRVMGEYADRRAKRRSPESNGRRRTDQ